MAADAISFSAVVLAAGAATRMQGRNKLLLPVGGVPAIRRTVHTVLEARPREVVVVTGFQAGAVSQALTGLPIGVQTNPRFEQGQATSVAAGVAALSQTADALMVCLGDMVLLTAVDYRELVDAFAQIGDKSILVPYHDGHRGNPVVLAQWLLPGVITGQCDPVCRHLIARHPEHVLAYQAAHDRFVTDMDTPADYARILGRLEMSGDLMVGHAA